MAAIEKLPDLRAGGDGGFQDAYYCALCEMWMGNRHVEDHLTGKKHRESCTGGEKKKVTETASEPASSSGVRVALISMAGVEVGAINVAPDSLWRDIAVEVRLQFCDLQAVPPTDMADVRAATGASMAAEGVQVIRRPDIDSRALS